MNFGIVKEISSDLMKANSLIDSANIIGVTLGMGSAGFLIHNFDIKYLYLLSAILCLLAIILDSKVEIKYHLSRNNANLKKINEFVTNTLSNYKSSIIYIKTHKKLIYFCSINILFFTILLLMQIALPVFCKETFSSNPKAFGLLASTYAIGGIIGNYVLNLASNKANMKKTFLLFCSMALAILVVFMHTKYTLIAYICYLLLGLFVTMCYISNVCHLQFNIDIDYQGKIRGILTLLEGVASVFFLSFMYSYGNYFSAKAIYLFVETLILTCIIVTFFYTEKIF